MARSNVYRMRIAFGDCDPAQIVFFANYFRWFDTAGREFFTACGVPSWRETTAERGIIGTPLVDAQATFRNSATYGEDIEIESWIEEWRGKSFVMRHVARRGDTVLCEGREVRVFATRDPDDPLRIKAVPIPDDIRAACA
ncbi:acyl-CoA thioesterase [Thauera sinica]|uniref:Acyl-CoA thioesterase n=1 Tax=Thauera sinica TaxID=2665146 RepID=A0ABW1AKM9_9RHOO|nr:thioesterase family protein [Thauera sp. K11]ATE61566.1 4-hydroxybenzoyl-CoA thioesterase [Thauera sp. K11]